MANLVLMMDDEEFEEIVRDGDKSLILDEARRARALLKVLFEERDAQREKEFHTKEYTTLPCGCRTAPAVFHFKCKEHSSGPEPIRFDEEEE